jgi:hypothetical protein
MNDPTSSTHTIYSYDGEWKDGKMEGRGVQLFARGDRYEGSVCLCESTTRPPCRCRIQESECFNGPHRLAHGLACTRAHLEHVSRKHAPLGPYERMCV